MANEKGSSILMGLIMVVFIFGGVFASQYLGEKINNNDNINSIAGWKTYSNAQYGFGIQYPVGTQINENKQDNGAISILFTLPSSGAPSRLFYINVATEAWYNLNTPSAVFKAPANCVDFNSSVITSINGVNFIKGDVSSEAAASRSSGTEYCMVKGDIAYKLTPATEYSPTDTHNVDANGFDPSFNVDKDAILNQMLSTFQFTNVDNLPSQVQQENQPNDLSSFVVGKPVIYLYPEKTTEVKVRFKKPVNFTVDIPTYQNGWDIMASPNGELKDLQSQITDCSKINYREFGSEYAEQSCKENNYPYLYWAGMPNGQYPDAQNKGWIVNRNDISNFMNSKLKEIGLNDKESQDMIEYWVPSLLKNNAPYYRISFFQNEEMNKFVPMNVTPAPDTVIRVFLDWSPFFAKPNYSLQPQTLNHIERKGFTYVEWGGLKQ